MRMKGLQASIALAFAVAACASYAADPAPAGPRPGKYRILSYGAPTSPPLYLGYFVLSGGGYKAYLPGDKPAGEGKYAFDAARHSVTWSSGPYKGSYGGAFTVEREGKTHKIRLNRTTIGTNSTDAP